MIITVSPVSATRLVKLRSAHNANRALFPSMESVRQPPIVIQSAKKPVLRKQETEPVENASQPLSCTRAGATMETVLLDKLFVKPLVERQESVKLVQMDTSGIQMLHLLVIPAQNAIPPA